MNEWWMNEYEFCDSNLHDDEFPKRFYILQPRER